MLIGYDLYMQGDEAKFEKIGNGELTDMFYESDFMDREIGRELCSRVLKHAGVEIDEIDIEKKPLSDKDRKPVLDRNDDPVAIVDYVNYAAENHVDAVPDILAILESEPGSEEHSRYAGIIKGRIGIA